MSSIQNKKRVFISTSIIIIFLLLLWAFIPNDSYQSIIQFRNINSEVTQDLLSEHCSVPFPGKPLIQYAVMVDAGSSGSRVHIYKFNFCKEEPELENEVFHMLEPGLSSFDDPERAADSLEELFQIAVDNVPLKLQRCTPIAVKATAGLRLLGQEKSKVILDTVRRRLETQYLFPISSVEIMDGKDEGVYAWITVNYLLGNFKSSSLSRSVATFDLGGASTQIVFEPEFPISAGKGIKPGDHLYELDYANHRYNLYQHSYLGYGLKEARKMIKTKVIELWQDRLPFGQIYHPCLPENYTEVISWKNESISTDIQLIGTGAGHAACRGIIEKIFNKEKVCPLAPCSFDGIYQPPLEETFIDRDLYVFSFFYDLTQPLGLPQEFTVREFGELANRVCSRDIEALKHVPNALHILKESPDYCLDLTYTHALLRIGYDISPERIVRTAKKINNAETGWCLGASIAMLNNNQLCRV